MTLRRFLAVTLLAILVSTPTLAQVSVSIGQPGFYGRLDIGGFPAPQLLFPEPVMIHRAPPMRPPLYLRVPPGHAHNWRRHCHRYRACGERVYFVQDDWYRHEYAPQYRERHSHRHGGYRDEYREDRRDYRDYREDRRERRHDDRGHGHGHGHGRGHD